MKRFPLFSFIVSGLLFGVSFVLSFAYWCFIPAFVLMLWGIAKEHSHRNLFLFGTITGTLHYAGSFYWVWSTFPIQWMPDAPLWIQMSAIGFYWGLTSFAMGLSGGMFALLAKRAGNTASALLLYIPIVWVVTEVFRSFLFSVYAFGPGSFLNIGFSYGYLGYLLAEERHLLQLSALGGVYALSYIAALVGTLAYLCIVHRIFRKPAVLSGVAGLLLCAVLVPAIPVHSDPHQGTRVIALETYFVHSNTENEDERAQRKAAVLEAVSLALQESPDAVVLPEDLRLTDGFDSMDAFFTWALAQSPTTSVVIIDNGPAIDARGYNVLRSYTYDLRTRSVYFSDKRYLVPQGEYISYLHTFVLSLFLPKEKLDAIKDFARFRPGVTTDNPAYPSYLPGILFCFETMVPYGVKRAAHFRSPEFIAHPISHSWFNNPFSLEYQLTSMLKVSAVWNDIPVVSAGDMTQSKLFLPSGGVDEGRILKEGDRWKLREFTF